MEVSHHSTFPRKLGPVHSRVQTPAGCCTTCWVPLCSLDPTGNQCWLCVKGRKPHPRNISLVYEEALELNYGATKAARYVIATLKSRPCTRCDQSFLPAAMDFHHLVASRKDAASGCHELRHVGTGDVRDALCLLPSHRGGCTGTRVAPSTPAGRGAAPATSVVERTSIASVRGLD